MSNFSSRVRETIEQVVFVPRGPDGRASLRGASSSPALAWEWLVNLRVKDDNASDADRQRALQELQRGGWRVLRCRLTEENAGEIIG